MGARARLQLADGVPLLRPGNQVFTAMLDGWQAQRLARNLAFAAIENRLSVVRAFAARGRPAVGMAVANGR